jgi:antitoxin (DNA-binding transcriptional repressor) of toxin-antitoxin stability system
MISAGIKNLKNNLSRYLYKVKKGEDILITERGKVIARIIREDPKNICLREALSPLIVKGFLFACYDNKLLQAAQSAGLKTLPERVA